MIGGTQTIWGKSDIMRENFRLKINKELDELIIIQEDLKMRTKEESKKIKAAEEKIQQKITEYLKYQVNDELNLLPKKFEGPPQCGELLLWLFSRSDLRDAVLGDLAEDYLKIFVQQGRFTAQIWYWWQVIRSVSAYIASIVVRVAAVSEALKKLGF